MKKFFRSAGLLIILLSGTLSLKAQVNISSNGGPVTTYSNIKAAFDNINSGLFFGNILIEITGAGTYTNPNAPAVLNSSGAGGAVYSSVLIRPTVDTAFIFATTTTGRGVIELNGADNVTIDGDNPNTEGINRNLKIQNLAANTVTLTSCYRIANSTAVVSSNNNSLINCELIGSAAGRNLSSAISAMGSENTTFGVYCGGNGGSAPTIAPIAVTSVTMNPAPVTSRINNLNISNNSVISCARGIVFNGASSLVSNGVTVSNNKIGSDSVLTGSSPFLSPVNTVYTKGIWISGANAVTVNNNSLKSILSFVGTTILPIELNGGIGTGTTTIKGNYISGVSNNSSFSGVRGISILNSSGLFNIDSNTILNLQGNGTAASIAISVAYSGPSGTIQRNRIDSVFSNNTLTYGSYGISIQSGNNVTIKNNSVSSLRNSQVSGTGAAMAGNFGVFGLRIAGGSGHFIYHNSVNLTGAISGSANTNFSIGLAIISAAQTGIDVRNNIISNQLTGGNLTGNNCRHVCLYLPSKGTSAMNLTLNNNAYFQGGSSISTLGQAGTIIGTGEYLAADFNADSTSPSSNMRSYTYTLSDSATNDSASLAYAEIPPFVSATNLHIPAGTGPTYLESGGAFTGVNTDIDDDVRPGPVGSIYGGAYAPDIGSDEFDGIPGTPLPDSNNVGITSSDLGGNRIYSAGKSYDFTATLKNFGAKAQSNIPVYYSVNGGAPVGPVDIAGPVMPDSSETVLFNGGFAFLPVSPGSNVVTIYTQLPLDTATGNDTFTVEINVQTKITAYPYIQTFSDLTDWTVLIENETVTQPIWGIAVCTGPDGAEDSAAKADYFNSSSGTKEILRSPEMDISALANPVLNFYSSYRSSGLKDDSLEVLVSTDGGVNFESATTVFNKGNSSIPSLATRPPSDTDFFPDSSSQWRHETVSLQNVQGSGNVVIGFRATSDSGNNAWIDNVIVSGSDSLCLSIVTAPGVYNCNPLLSIDFTSFGDIPSEKEPGRTSSGEKIPGDKIRTNSFGYSNVNPFISSSSQAVNPTGGDAYVMLFSLDSNSPGIDSNVTATTQNGSVYTPSKISGNNYFRVTYTGNDQTGYASYNVSLDITGSDSIFSAENAYIMKRTDQTGNWECLNTTSSGSVLTASGLNTFSDFAVGYSIQRLELTFRLQVIQLTRKDTLTVNLRSSVIPYNIIDSAKAVYDSLTGISKFSFHLAQNDSSYYLEVRHRNSIATWTSMPVMFVSDSMSYDFTSSAAQAYGSNQIEVKGIPSFYTGDVDQNGIVDSKDVNILIYNDVLNFVSGSYIITDLNYDGFTDSDDLLAAFNNQIAFVGVKKP